MTNWQLFVSAGLPSLLVLLSIWRSDKRMDGMDVHMDHLETRMDWIASDLKQFYQIFGRPEEAIDTLKK